MAALRIYVCSKRRAGDHLSCDPCGGNCEARVELIPGRTHCTTHAATAVEAKPK